MKLKAVTVGGFKNLDKTTFHFDRMGSLISLNNYGKSNLLEAVDFGIDFINASPKTRKSMMNYKKGIPLTPSLASTEYFFELELQNDAFDEYRFIKYGFSFAWYRDDQSGQKITDEWLELRKSESIRFKSFLKRDEGKYRRRSSTEGLRKIVLDDYQLSIDVLAAIDDNEIYPVIKLLQNINYHICSSLDVGERFHSVPVEYIGDSIHNGLEFDDLDMPRALFEMKEKYPDKYDAFSDAVMTLFPEFVSIKLQSMDFDKDSITIKTTLAGAEPSDTNVPFRIKEKIYRLLVTSAYLNQPVSMSSMSTGTKRIIWLLTNVLIASSTGMCFLGIEELETSIHPRMLKNLLEILVEALDETTLIISSHSPFLIQYMKPDAIYIGMPNDEGIASFRRLLPGKIKYLLSASRDLGLSLGEFIFELLSGDKDSLEQLDACLERG